MPTNGLKDWRFIAGAIVLLGGSGFGGGVLFANDKPARSEVKEMIEDHPVIVVLQKDVEHLSEKVDLNQEENRAQFRAVLEAIKANGGVRE